MGPYLRKDQWIPTAGELEPSKGRRMLEAKTSIDQIH